MYYLLQYFLRWFDRDIYLQYQHSSPGFKTEHRWLLKKITNNRVAAIHDSIGA